MRRILIVGAGQSGLQLGLSLLSEGYDVTVLSARTADEIRAGWIMSTQAMFAQALDHERAYGLDLWEGRAPRFDALHVSLSSPPGERALRVVAPLDEPGQSIDQRLKMSAWLDLLAARGGTLKHEEATPADLDRHSREYDLTVVAAGKSELADLFPRDAARSPHTTPQRALAVAYVRGLAPDPLYPTPNVGFNAVPGLGELFVIPGLTFGGPCDMLFWEAIPGGPLDRWQRRLDPAEHLAVTLDLAREYVPWVYERCAGVELTDGQGTLSGRYTPTVREPIGALPSGGLVLGMADVVVTNDPVTGQGSNAAAKCAAVYLAAILARGERPFDRAWMEETFARFWESAGRPTTEWTNAMLGPLPEHVERILGTAAECEPVARRLGNGFSDPGDFQHWLMAPDKTDAYLASVAGA